MPQTSSRGLAVLVCSSYSPQAAGMRLQRGWNAVGARGMRLASRWRSDGELLATGWPHLTASANRAGCSRRQATQEVTSSAPGTREPARRSGAGSNERRQRPQARPSRRAAARLTTAEGRSTTQPLYRGLRVQAGKRTPPLLPSTPPPLSLPPPPFPCPPPSFPCPPPPSLDPPTPSLEPPPPSLDPSPSF